MLFQQHLNPVRLCFSDMKKIIQEGKEDIQVTSIVLRDTDGAWGTEVRGTAVVLIGTVPRP